MDLLTFSIFSALILLILIKYNQHSTKQALLKRYELIDYLKNIIHSDNYSDQFKNLCIHIISDSMDKNLLPKILLYITVSFFKDSSYKNKAVSEYKNIIGNNQTIYNEVIKKMITVNILNAIHWYILLGLSLSIGALIYLVFKQFNKLIDNVSIIPSNYYLRYQVNHNT